LSLRRRRREAAGASPAPAAGRPSTSDSGASRTTVLGQPRVSGDVTRPTSSCPRPVAGQLADVRERRQERQPITPSTLDHTAHQVQSGKNRMTRATTHESTDTCPVNVGFSASQGAFRTHQEDSGYACHLVPRLERGGRRITASHQSRDRTLPRPPGGSSAKPQQSRTIRTTRSYRAALRGRRSNRHAYPPRRLFPGPTRAERAGVRASVEAGVIACGHGHLPKSPGEIRVKSALSHSNALQMTTFCGLRMDQLADAYCGVRVLRSWSA